MKKIELLKRINESPARSAWIKGVKEYAFELVEALELDDNAEIIKGVNLSTEILLNGAEDWAQYSWGGSALIYNEDIAFRLCTPSEFKRTDGGFKKPNSHEQWLDVQSRALYQAAALILKLI